MFRVYIDKNIKRLRISPIEITEDGVEQVMGTNDLNSAKMFCMGYVMGQNYSDNCEILVLNDITEFADSVKVIDKF